MDQLPISGPEAGPELRIRGVGYLLVEWTLDIGSRTVQCVWTMGDASGPTPVAHGTCEAFQEGAWMFGEGGWLIRKLRELQARTDPFPA